VLMPAIDPRAKAAECDSAIERVSDPERRIVLETLRDLWIDLCTPVSPIYETDRAVHISTIVEIHNDLMASSKMAMH
jgi:hypothetical protein